jgi:hypothetical protein
MKAFQNLTESVTYHRRCYVCHSHLQNNLDLTLNLEKNLYKWNLSENVDSETDDWIVINALTNKVDSIRQTRRNDNELLYSGMDLPMVNRFQRHSKSLNRSYSGVMYESMNIDCQKCYHFGYTVQVVIDLTSMALKGIYLNSEFISYPDEDGHLHEIKNVYAIDKTEYSYHVTPTEQYDASKKRMSIPIIPLDLNNPADTVARIRKLLIFS